VQQKFFDKLADVLDRFATYFLPLPTTLKGQHSSSFTARHYHLLPSVAQAGHGLASESWPDDVDELAALYDDELNSIVGRILPLRQYDRRARPSDPWFDKVCSDAKRLTRRLERADAAACRRSARGSTTPSDWDQSARVASAKTAW